jgi:hypothetical protein
MTSLVVVQVPVLLRSSLTLSGWCCQRPERDQVCVERVAILTDPFGSVLL